MSAPGGVTNALDSDRRAMLWGVVVGFGQAATPLLFWWLNSATVYALGIIVIASIYVGFAVADGRLKVIAVESSVTLAFVIVAAAAVTGSPWLLVAGLVGHGLKDLWQHRSHFVANTRWWPLHGYRLGRRGDHRPRDRCGIELSLGSVCLSPGYAHRGRLLESSRSRGARCRTR